MIPAAFSSLFKTRWDWNYETTEQKQLHGRRAYWPRMKALGGPNVPIPKGPMPTRMPRKQMRG